MSLLSLFANRSCRCVWLELCLKYPYHQKMLLLYRIITIFQVRSKVGWSLPILIYCNISVIHTYMTCKCKYKFKRRSMSIYRTKHVVFCMLASCFTDWHPCKWSSWNGNTIDKNPTRSQSMHRFIIIGVDGSSCDMCKCIEYGSSSKLFGYMVRVVTIANCHHRLTMTCCEFSWKACKVKVKFIVIFYYIFKSKPSDTRKN